MIVSIFDVEENVYQFTTNGCGCCSINLVLPEDREEIIKNLKENITVVKEGCELLGITLEELTEE